ncbi:hypothetical protein ACFQU2_09750 [Siccirubricoccus deserti]
MSLPREKTLLRYGLPGSFVEPDYAVSWLAFGSALPAYAWDHLLYPGAARWPNLDGKTLLDGLERLASAPARYDQDRVVAALVERVQNARYKAERAASPNPAEFRLSQSLTRKAEVKTPDLVDEARRWLGELSDAPFDPRMVSEALYSASSKLRRSAANGEVSVFALNERCHHSAVLWLIDYRTSDSEYILVPCERFDQLVYFGPDGLQVPNRYSYPRDPFLKTYLNISVRLDGGEIESRWPDPDPQRIWTNAEDAAPAQPPWRRPKALAAREGDHRIQAEMHSSVS